MRAQLRGGQNLLGTLGAWATRLRGAECEKHDEADERGEDQREERPTDGAAIETASIGPGGEAQDEPQQDDDQFHIWYPQRSMTAGGSLAEGHYAHQRPGLLNLVALL